MNSDVSMTPAKAVSFRLHAKYTSAGTDDRAAFTEFDGEFAHGTAHGYRVSVKPIGTPRMIDVRSHDGSSHFPSRQVSFAFVNTVNSVETMLRRKYKNLKDFGSLEIRYDVKILQKKIRENVVVAKKQWTMLCSGHGKYCTS